MYKGQISIEFLNTIREVELCIALGYIVVVNEMRIEQESELFFLYKKLRKELDKCNEKRKSQYIISSLNKLSSFFYRNHISEKGDETQRDEIRKLNLHKDYWTEI